jgi:hypothetical protein
MPDIWDELKPRIINGEDHVLFDEATNSARVGSLRASYIAVWLSCAESLKRKFKDAATTDNEANKTVGDIEDKETKQHAVDAFVLEESKKYGFISDAEFALLEHVYAQRCVYGHPYEQAPLLIQLHSAATTVVEYVLSRPTQLRHGYLSRQVELICKNSTFLDDYLPAIEAYAQIVYSRSASDLHLWFLQKIWKESLSYSSDPTMALFTRRVRRFSLAFLRLCSDSWFQDWDVSIDLVSYPFISTVLSAEDLFTRIGDHPQDIVVGNILQCSKTQVQYLKLIEKNYFGSKLTPRQEERFLAALQEFETKDLATAGVNATLYVDRVIQKLSSHDWYAQNAAMDVVIGMGISGITAITTAKQIELGNNVLQAAEGTAKEAVSFLADLSRDDKEWPEYFIEGIIAECVVNDDNKYRFKVTYSLTAFQCLRVVPIEKRKPLVERIVARLKGAQPKYTFSSYTGRDELIKALDDAIASDTTRLRDLIDLKNAVTTLGN